MPSKVCTDQSASLKPATLERRRIARVISSHQRACRPDRASGRGVGTAILAGQLLGPRQHERSRHEAEASSVSETSAGAAVPSCRTA